MAGVRIIEKMAFACCIVLKNVDFGDKLETIGFGAFSFTSLRNIKLPKIRVIENFAFAGCEQLKEVKLSEDLERIGERPFLDCRCLRRIAMPLKDDMFDEVDDDHHAFHDCDNHHK